MTRFVLSPAAQADIDDIWDYSVARWSVAQAEKYVRAIGAACEELASGRVSGRAIDDVRPGYLKYPVGSHFIFFRVANEGVIDVIRILHQRMDVKAKL